MIRCYLFVPVDSETELARGLTGGRVDALLSMLLGPIIFAGVAVAAIRSGSKGAAREPFAPS